MFTIPAPPSDRWEVELGPAVLGAKSTEREKPWRSPDIVRKGWYQRTVREDLGKSEQRV